MALNKRIWRVLMENKGRYIGILILIMLGSFFFILETGIGDNLEKLVGGFAEGNMQEDVSFSSGGQIDDISALESEAGAIIDAYRYCDVTLTGGQTIRLISPCKRINLPVVLSGKNLGQQGDILIDPNFASVQGFDIGSTLNIGGNAYNVTGTVALPHYIYPLKFIYDVAPPSGFGISLISDADMEGFPQADTVYAARFASRENIPAQTVKLHKLLDDKGFPVSDWVDAASNRRIRLPWASVESAKAMSIPVPTAMFLLCCIIVGVVIWRIVKSDSVVIGTLYAQGYRRRELIRHYMTIPLILSCVGGFLGVLLAFPCIEPSIVATIAVYNMPMTGISLSPVYALIGVLMPMVFLGMAGFLVIRKELAKTAGELMKGDAQKSKVNFLERSFKLEKFNFNARFRLRAQLRSISRLLFLLLGVAGASLMLLFGFNLQHATDLVFKSGSEDMYVNINWEYAFKVSLTENVPDGAEAFSTLRCYPEGKENAEFGLMGVQADSRLLIMRDAQGNDLSKDGVNITLLLADRLRLRVGDTFPIVNKLTGEIYSLTVDGIIDTYGGQFVYMPLDGFNRMTGQEQGSYSGLYSAHELNYDDRLLSSIKDLKSLEAGMADIIMPMTMVVVCMIAVGGLMGCIIIFLVTSLMIEESRSSISMLKVFGYRNKEVGKLILNSSTPVVVAGFLLGVPVTMLSANALFSYIGEVMNMVLPTVAEPLYILLCFALILAVYWLTKQLCGRKLAKISMSEALKAGTE